MAEERLAFAYEVVPLSASDSEDRHERLLETAESLARELAGQSADPFDEIRPSLVLETEGETSAAFWPVLTAVSDADFLAIVVPSTLESLDPDAAALVRVATFTHEGGVPVDGVVVQAIDRLGAEQPGITLAAPFLCEHQDFLLGSFEVLGSGLDPVIAMALRRPVA